MFVKVEVTVEILSLIVNPFAALDVYIRNKKNDAPCSERVLSSSFLSSFFFLLIYTSRTAKGLTMFTVILKTQLNFVSLLLIQKPRKLR